MQVAFRHAVWMMPLFLSQASLAHPDEWPQVQRNRGNATANSAQVPLNWSADQGIAWKAKLPGRGASSPIVWNNRIFVTAYTGYGTEGANENTVSDLRLHVICLDRNSGNILWDKSIAASEASQDFSKRVQEHGYATSTPATDGQAVYAFFGVSGVVAFDFDGNQLWRADVGNRTAGFGSASSPVVFRDLVIVNASIESNTLFAFDKKTGDKVWSLGNIQKSWSTPCIAKATNGSVELVMNQKDEIFGLDPTDGTVLWNCVGIQDYVVPVPIAHEGVVYCLGGRQNRCIAVRLGGRGDVTETHKLWEVTIGANVTSPVYHDGYLYWASDKAVANCLNVKNGEAMYRERLKTRARIYGSAILASEHLFIPTRDKGVVVVEARPEYKEVAINTIETDQDMLNASPAVAGNQLLLRTDSYLYCIGNK